MSKVILFVALITGLPLALISAEQAHGEGTCTSAGSRGPINAYDSVVGAWDVRVSGEFECRGGARVAVIAASGNRGESGAPSVSAHSPSVSGIVALPIYCRRDDYMFLPANALGGIPCLSIPSASHFDPHALAVSLAAQVPPPDLRIGMNPAKGMVRVPTWFWVEGYDGGTLDAEQTVREDDTSCHTVPIRGANGLAVLDGNNQPRTRTDCVTTTTTFDVQVRLFPTHFSWDFGDAQRQDIGCAGIGDCGNALGMPYSDALHASPIRHPYLWSSLGANGSADAYTVTLGIDFGAQYRVSVNGRDQGGWQGLNDRMLVWSAAHQVQEAQAVLTRPCVASVAVC